VVSVTVEFLAEWEKRKMGAARPAFKPRQALPVDARGFLF
jgi:hypothetical protein